MPFPYKQILCPVDFDDNSVHAVEEASPLILHGEGRLCLLHVVQINILATQGFGLGELYDSQEKYAREKLNKIAEEKLAGVECEIMIERGDPAHVILVMEEKLPADLVVMATHGRRGITRLVLGSVAERVVRESSTPVLTVRPARANKANFRERNRTSGTKS